MGSPPSPGGEGNDAAPAPRAPAFPEGAVAPPTWAEALEAAARLRREFPATPLLPAPAGAGDHLSLKVETLLPTGSFKVRGVGYAAFRLEEEQVRAGLSTVSAGNTALALAWAAARLGTSARSLLPETAPAAKVEAFRAVGGIPRLRPVEELFRFLRERRFEAEPYAFLHPWIEPLVHRGHSSLAVEILESAPDLESLFVPVGGGGLLAGVAGALKDRRPELRVFAVEPTGCCALHRSLLAGRAVASGCRTICDGVAVPYLTGELYPALAALVDETVLVTDEETLAASRRLLFAGKILTEPSGALAAAGARKTPLRERGHSVALVTGAGIGPPGLRRLLGGDRPAAGDPAVSPAGGPGGGG